MTALLRDDHQFDDGAAGEQSRQGMRRLMEKHHQKLERVQHGVLPAQNDERHQGQQVSRSFHSGPARCFEK